MAYPQPSAVLTDLSLKSSSNERVVLEGKTCEELEIEFLRGVGVCMELRHDRVDSTITRQPYTSLHEELAKEQAAVQESPQEVTISHESIVLRFDRTTARFSLTHNDETLIQSDSAAFSRLTERALISELAARPDIEDLANSFPFVKTAGSYSTYMIRFRYRRPSGLILGLAGSTGELNRNGYRFDLYNTDSPQHLPNRKSLYQSWPILFHQSFQGQKWIAVFHDNPVRTTVDIGDYDPESVTFDSICNNSRVYLIWGGSLSEVSRKLSTLLGPPLFPPSWAFGYQQSRWSYLSSEEVRELRDSFRAYNLPLDCIYFDIDYMDGYRVFTQNPKAFADLPQLVDELHSDGIQSVCIIDPGVKIDPAYKVYRELEELGSYLKEENGAPLVAHVWPGDVLLPDFGDPKAQVFWSDLQAEWLKRIKCDGCWNDMNEPSNWDGANKKISQAITARGRFETEYNLYAYYMAQTSLEGWNKVHPDSRGLLITRSGYPGIQRSAVIWHGDNHAWWEHLRLAIDMAITYSLSGVYYTGADVPGFQDNPPDDLAVRFFQVGSFLPMFRGHADFLSKRKEPFRFGSAALAVIRDTISLRYSLLREWYSGYERSFRKLRPPIVPVLDERCALVRDQFILFDKFLVAPITQRDQSHKLVFLPDGDWYALGDTTTRIRGKGYVQLEVGLHSLPVFVRAGSIVTRNNPGRNVQETFAAEETFEIYPSLDGTASTYWYSDDGVTQQHESAKRKLIQCSTRDAALTTHRL